MNMGIARQRKWIIIAGPTIIIAIFDYLRHQFFFELLHQWPTTVFMAAGIILLAAWVSYTLSRHFEKREQSLLYIGRELSSLHAEATSHGLGPHQLAEAALTKVTNLLGIGSGAIFLANEKKGDLILTSERGWSPEFLTQVSKTKLMEKYHHIVGRPQEILIFPDSLDDHLPLGKLMSIEQQRSFACVPLASREKTIGIMVLASRDPHFFTFSDRDLLLTIGHHVGVIIDNAELFDEAHQRAEEAEVLYKIGTEISARLDIDQVLDSVVKKAQQLLRTEVAALALLDDDREFVRWRMLSSEAEECQETRLPLGQDGLDKIYATGRTIVVEDMNGLKVSFSASLPIEDLKALLAVALKMGEQVMGCLMVANRIPSRFGPEQSVLLSSLANHAAIAITNARLYEQAQNVAIMEERDRIAREMHDSLAQVLGFLSLKANTTRELLPSGNMPAISTELQGMAEVAEEAYTDVREAILGLKDSISAEKGLAGTLSGYLQKFSRQSKVGTRLVLSDGTIPPLDPIVEIQLIRVIQEALTNVRKHARATKAWVRFETSDDEINITIEDNGQGFKHTQTQYTQGFGIPTMKERVESIGGTLSIESAPGQGTKVIVNLPADRRHHGSNKGSVSRRSYSLPKGVG